MKQSSPLESPKNLFHQNQPSKSLQVPKSGHNVVRNLGVNFEDLMPTHSGPTSPNFQKMSDFLKGPSFASASKPISMVLPEFSQNSCIIPLQDNCLETSMPFEDLVGQLESPKLSDKMQMIFNSNVNLSESIMKNTFRAVDESRVKIEDKDLQVELEIRELKLHHLQKRVEDCLASSKNTLALNVQLSQNVSKMVSPIKSTHDVLSSNIKRRTSSRLHSPNTNIEDLSAVGNGQLASSRSDTSFSSKSRPKSVNYTVEKRQEELNGRSFPLIQDNNAESEVAPQEESPEFRRNGSLVEREITSMAGRNYRSASLPPAGLNSRSKDTLINEAYQKLGAYTDSNKVELTSQPPQAQVAEEDVKPKPYHHKSTESIASNNITFYTNLPEKDTQIDVEEQTKNLTRFQSNDCLSEDQESCQRSQFLFHSKSRETIYAPNAPEPKSGSMPKEISLTDADGKERIFIIKPKETLSFQKLETICINSLESRGGLGFKQQRVRSQFSSFQLSETEEFPYMNENPKNAQDPIPNIHSKKMSIYDNSNVASLTLDKSEYRPSTFNNKAIYEPQFAAIGNISNQKDSYLEYLRSQILNHPNCRQFFSKDDLMVSDVQLPEISSRDNEGLEVYFKQRIQDCREFLSVFEKILPSNASFSPIKEAPKKRKKVNTAINEELPRSNRGYETTDKIYASENFNLESKTVENTPRNPFDENDQVMKEKYYTSSKRGFASVGYLTEQSPQNINMNSSNNNRFESDNEFVPKQLFKENAENPYLMQPNFVVRQPSSTSNGEKMKKKTKSMKNSTPSSSKAIKIGKNHSMAFPLVQTSEPIKNKAHDKTSSIKSPKKISTKKSNIMANIGFVEVKIPKDKTFSRANSKSNVDVINVAKAQARTSGAFVISPAQ